MSKAIWIAAAIAVATTAPSRAPAGGEPAIVVFVTDVRGATDLVQVPLILGWSEIRPLRFRTTSNHGFIVFDDLTPGLYYLSCDCPVIPCCEPRYVRVDEFQGPVVELLYDGCPAQLLLAPPAPQPGTALDLSGRCDATRARDPVEIWFDDQLLGMTTGDYGDGVYHATVTIPLDAQEGEHAIRAIVKGTEIANQILAVSISGTPPSDAPTATASIPDTSTPTPSATPSSTAASPIPDTSTPAPSGTPSSTATATPMPDTATPAPSDTPSSTGTATSMPATTATPSPLHSCVGDCDGSGDVTVDELITMVNIALGDAAVSSCPMRAPAADVVTIDLIIAAVHNSLDHC